MCSHSLSVDKRLFDDITEKNVIDTGKLYKSQVPALWDAGIHTDSSLIQLLTIGRCHQFDFLQHLTDDFAVYFRGVRSRILWAICVSAHVSAHRNPSAHTNLKHLLVSARGERSRERSLPFLFSLYLLCKCIWFGYSVWRFPTNFTCAQLLFFHFIVPLFFVFWLSIYVPMNISNSIYIPLDIHDNVCQELIVSFFLANSRFIFSPAY